MDYLNLKNQVYFENEVQGTFYIKSIVWQGLIDYGKKVFKYVKKKLEKNIKNISFIFSKNEIVLKL